MDSKTFAVSCMPVVQSATNVCFYLSRKSPHGVSAHSTPLQVSKLSTSVLDAELQECQHISPQMGMNEPRTPAVAGLDIVFANSRHSLERSLSISPAMQIASVRGLTSDLMNSRMLATIASGGGGGVGGGSTETPPVGGGGLQCKSQARA